MVKVKSPEMQELIIDVNPDSSNFAGKGFIARAPDNNLISSYLLLC